MLRELHIRNFSIIDEISIEFEEGLNVITGETGAGKSIIINALSLAIGERASQDVIRSGEEETVIEAFFEITPDLIPSDLYDSFLDQSIDIDDGLILKRIITAKGKSRAYVNSSLIPLHGLLALTKYIADIHGQYEHQSLLSPERQLDVIDMYGRLGQLRRDVGSIYERYIKVKNEIRELEEKEKDRAQRLDIIRYQVDEIKKADLKPDEEEALQDEAKLLAGAERLTEVTGSAYEEIYASDTACLSRLSQIADRLKEISEIDPRLKESIDNLDEAITLLQEVAYFLRDYRDGIEFDPIRLDQIQQRLELIRNLKRKYGDSIEEVLKFMERAEKEYEDLLHSGERLDILREELNLLKNSLTEKARELSKRRMEAARSIEKEVITNLEDLGMKGARFSISFKKQEGDDTTDGYRVFQKGIDQIEFLISTNPGEDLRPLSKVASGGELSRIMLVLKEILARGDDIPVLIFDEIDAGIGGRTAEKVARKLKKLSTNRQVICITHLPQIASFADRHLKIEKTTKGKRTTVKVYHLKDTERVREIARMLGGNITDTSLRHAEELLMRT